MYEERAPALNSVELTHLTFTFHNLVIILKLVLSLKVKLIFFNTRHVTSQACCVCFFFVFLFSTGVCDFFFLNTSPNMAFA